MNFDSITYTPAMPAFVRAEREPVARHHGVIASLSRGIVGPH